MNRYRGRRRRCIVLCGSALQSNRAAIHRTRGRRCAHATRRKDNTQFSICAAMRARVSLCVICCGCSVACCGLPSQRGPSQTNTTTSSSSTWTLGRLVIFRTYFHVAVEFLAHLRTNTRSTSTSIISSSTQAAKVNGICAHAIALAGCFGQKFAVNDDDGCCGYGQQISHLDARARIALLKLRRQFRG